MPSASGQQIWSVTANAGAVVTAIAASACCVGPLVLALLGIGSGALLVSLEPYRPYFTALTLGLLAAGFYLQYRKPKPTTIDGVACDCPTPRSHRLGRIMLWVATVMVLAFLGFPYVTPYIFG